MNLRSVAASLQQRLGAASSSQLTEALFLKLLGLVYCTSFSSFWPQIAGLSGPRGIAPAGAFLTSLRAHSGLGAYIALPTLFWFDASDAALTTCCVIGCLAGLVLMSGFFTRAAASVCWILYLSLVIACQPFSNFQWDALLLESGFLALFAGASLAVWAYRFLLFRLMFESGIVKLLSHDPNWTNLHALRYHFMTQPLPTPVAFYAYRMPAGVLDAMTAAALAIELIAPFFLFGPKTLRYISVVLLMLLQIVILITGNYAFFNLLTLALCLCGLDDSCFICMERFLRPGAARLRSMAPRVVLNSMLIALMAVGAIQVVSTMTPMTNKSLSALLSALAPFEIVNRYGLFAVMTTTRPEVIIEGSEDQVNWREYSFKYKPGELHRGLPLVAPYQPRLDWQMWFAAQGAYEENRWAGGLMYRLLTGENTVLRLMDPPPFSKPPHYMRALLYDYQFTTPSERARTGAVWQRTLLGPWFGPVSLTGR